jgi:hypothetical protein
LLKRIWTLTVILVVVAAPAFLLAAGQSVVVGKLAGNTDRTVTVPLEVTNQDNLTALDIPLKYSEGVTLKEVRFENTRVSYFDLKVARIDPQNRTVVIGLLPQTSPTRKPDLAAGTGVVANLIFEVDDPSVSAINLETVKLENPHHSLTFVYHQVDASGKVVGQRREEPEFNSVSASLSGVGANLPQQYDLGQNYPNPFNPTTEIEFALPKGGQVNLVVYNVLGQEVKTLVNGQMDAGSHKVQWDGTNSQGQSVSSGIYFYRLSAEQYNATRKMLMLK